MIKTLINSIFFGFVFTHPAAAMAPAIACGPSQCPWLDTSHASTPEEVPPLVLKRFPSDGIENFMPLGRNDDNGIPPTVEGLWWMNFNQDGDILATFGTAVWDEETRTAKIPVYGERTYSFHATRKAASSYAPLLATRYTYIVKFNEDFTYAEIIPQMRILGRQVTIPKAVAHFTMRYIEDGHWLRESWVLGHRLPDYHLLRIVKPDFSRDPAYADYLKIADEESYLAVPRDSNEP